MTISIYKEAWKMLMAKPVRLWGLSLLNILLIFLIGVFGILPIITIPVTLTLSAGMSVMFLDGYRGRQVNSDQLFEGFKNFPHVAGGMCWRQLWLLIWSIIPVAGVVKALSYAFVPYILIENPSVSATEALRESMRRTKGIKGQMFIALILPIAAFAMVFIILSLMSLIPIVGSFFATINALITIAYLLLINLFLGLVLAGFYSRR